MLYFTSFKSLSLDYAWIISLTLIFFPGKTVTSLALITSTAGLLPQRPVASWEKQDVNNDWQKLRGQFETYLTPIIVKICKRTDPGDHIDFLWNLASDIKRDEKHCETIQTFENAG